MEIGAPAPGDAEASRAPCVITVTLGGYSRVLGSTVGNMVFVSTLRRENGFWDVIRSMQCVADLGGYEPHILRWFCAFINKYISNNFNKSLGPKVAANPFQAMAPWAPSEEAVRAKTRAAKIKIPTLIELVFSGAFSGV